MLFTDQLILVRGGGDLATGAVQKLHRAGFPVVVLELAAPLTIRRAVAVSSAVTAGRAIVEDLEAVLVENVEVAGEVARSGAIPVVVSSELPRSRAAVVVDARMAKRKLDTSISDAALVVGLGPGFAAGIDCHAVVETKRGHHLGRVLWEGAAAADTGLPGSVGGESGKRVIKAPRSGRLQWNVAIGDAVATGDELGTIDGASVSAGISGVVRGLLAEGTVSPGLKLADIDPRGDPMACFEISDKARSVGGGVLEAVLTWLNR